MNLIVDSLAYWLADFYLAATVLLVAALVAMRACSQPAKRLAVAKAAIVAAGLLGVLCALPGWSVVSLGGVEARESTKAASAVIPSNVARVNDVPRFEVEPVAQVAAPLPQPKRAEVARSWGVPWLTLLVAGFFVGSSAVATWLALGVVAAARLVQRAETFPGELRVALRGETDAGELLVSREIDVPVALGVFRPRVLLPLEWIETRSTAELSTVLAHEAAHIRNHDLRWLAASRLLLVVLWAQPLFWWLRRQMRLDQETLADAAAAEVAGRQAYAEQLVAWARDIVVRPRPLLPASVGLWEGASQLRRRVAVLIDERFVVLRDCSRRLRWTSFLLCGTVALVLSAVTFQPTRSQTDGELPKREAEPERKEISGRVVLPDGKPAVGIQVTAFSMSEAGNHSKPYGYQRTVTDAEGRFRLSIYSGGEEVFWILPRDFVQQTHVINERRGDLGTFELKSGLFFYGRAIDKDGKPIRNIWVNAELVEGPPKQPIEMAVADNVRRSSLTDKEGKFQLGPLPPGIYKVGPDEMPQDSLRNFNESRRKLPAAFLPQRIELTGASELEEIEIKPVDSVTVQVRFVDSSGKPTDGFGFFLNGTEPEGQRISLRRGPTRRGESRQIVTFHAPKGLTRTVLDFPIDSIRVRRASDEPWESDWSLDLGTLDRDWREIEVVRYRTPTLVVTAHDAEGKAIPDFKPALFYLSREQRTYDAVRGDVNFEPQADGRWRSEHLLPDEEFTLKVAAEGYEPFEVTQKIPEGERKEVEAELIRGGKPDSSETGRETNAKGAKAAANPEATRHLSIGGGTVTRFEAGYPATPWDFEPNAVRLEIEDVDGKPVAGVEATLFRVTQATGEREQLREVTGDAEGVVEFRDVVAAEAAREFQEKLAAGEFPGSVRDIFYIVLKRPQQGTVMLPVSDFTVASRGSKRRVRMRPAAELTGRVTDQEGKPVSGATVAVGTLGGVFAVDGANATVSDSNGDFHFANLSEFNRDAAMQRAMERGREALAAQDNRERDYPAIYDPAEEFAASDLVATHPDFAATQVEGGNIPGKARVVMNPAAAIEGRVVEFGTGKPAAGVLVKAVGQNFEQDSDVVSLVAGSSAPLFSGSSHSAATRTDDEGRYRLSSLPAGTYDVWVEPQSNDWSTTAWVSRGVTGIRAEAGKAAAVAPELTIGPGATIRGRLIDATTGKATELGTDGASVQASFLLGEPQSLQVLPMERVAVGPDGEFPLRVVPGALRVMLIVSKTGDRLGSPGNYRSDDDVWKTGQLFELQHGENVEASFRVWPWSVVESLRSEVVRGFELLNAGKLTEARAVFSDVIAKDAKNTAALQGRAQAYDASGQMAEAIADTERLLELNANDMILLNNLAHLLATSPNEADRDGKRAVELAQRAVAQAEAAKLPGASRAEFLDTLAAAQAEAGDFEAAVKTQREAMEQAGDGAKSKMEKRLAAYEAGRAWRREVERD